MGISARHAPALDLPARFMGLSLAAFALAMGLAPFTLHVTQGAINDFRLLALIHLVTLGFIGSMVIGASYQLVPVVLQTELASIRAGRFSFSCYVAGLGFFLTSLVRTWIPGLGIGGSLLAVAFVLYAGNVYMTWRRARYHDVIGWHIVAGVLGSLMGMSMGVLLAFNKGNGMLGAGLFGFLGAHIVYMLGGWLVVTMMGVTYRLVCMFTLSEKHFQPKLAWAALILVVSGVWTLATALHLEWDSRWCEASALLALAGFACFGWQVVVLYRRRMRRVIDVHMPFVSVAGALLLLVPVLTVIGFAEAARPNHPLWPAIIVISLLGVFGTAIQGFFYKISTFLVWLKRYSPVAGRATVPKLDELYSRTLAWVGLSIWTGSVIATAILLLARIDAMELAGLGLLTGAACFFANVGRIISHWLRGPRLPLREPIIPREPHRVKVSA